ncbi:MAG: hypothetical protein H7259_00185 [Cytophagales bacterium]|nr:hypothetical protein [Cytophaga sp.]
MVYKFFSKKEGEVKNHLVEYLRLLNADHKDHPEEVKKIIEIAERNGMRGNEIRSLITEISADKIKTPENDDDRFEQLFYLINLVLNDNLLDSTEFDFCNDIGARLGYPAQKVPQITREMYNGIKYELNEVEIKKKVTSLLQ